MSKDLYMALWLMIHEQISAAERRIDGILALIDDTDEVSDTAAKHMIASLKNERKALVKYTTMLEVYEREVAEPED